MITPGYFKVSDGYCGIEMLKPDTLSVSKLHASTFQITQMSGSTIRVDGGKAYTLDEVADIIRWWQAEDR